MRAGALHKPELRCCSHGSCQACVEHAPPQYQAYVSPYGRHSELSRKVPPLLTPFSHKKDPDVDSENTPCRSDTPSIRSYLLISLFGVCLFLGEFWCIEKLGLPPEKNLLAGRLGLDPLPQHLKVLKHFVYIQYGCGMWSMGVCSLNHDTATSYRLVHTPCSLKFTPTCTCNMA